MPPEAALTSKLMSDTMRYWEPGQFPLAKNTIAERYAAGKLIRIFGPCSLISVPQILDMLAIISKYVDLMRAPGDKPRTRPVKPTGELEFDGIGSAAAGRIYAEVVREFPQLLFASEIMVAEVLKLIHHQLGLVWVGSRSQEKRTNQEIGAAAAEYKLPVMIKNPMVPDLQMYLGMIENVILGSGGKVPVMACLRGISAVGTDMEGKARNIPNYEWIKLLKQEFPQMPIIIDPSHMPNKADLTPVVVAETVRIAVAEGADGYMVELNTPDYPSKTDPGTSAVKTLEEFEKRGLL